MSSGLNGIVAEVRTCVFCVGLAMRLPHACVIQQAIRRRSEPTIGSYRNVRARSTSYEVFCDFRCVSHVQLQLPFVLYAQARFRERSSLYQPHWVYDRPSSCVHEPDPEPSTSRNLRGEPEPEPVIGVNIIYRS